MKRSRLLNILCSMLVGVIFMIAMLAVMIFSGAVSLQRTDLVFSTESASAVYDGKPLTNHQWNLVSGELKKGHRAQVTVTGSQTSSGESDNTMQVKILDAADADVTGDYTINYTLGKLKVTPRELTVTSAGATKVYDGSPLTNSEYEVGSIIPGHKAVVLVTGSQTEIGFSSNTIQMIRVLDRSGTDVTHNYQVTKIEGPLMVTNGDSGLNFNEQDNEINPDELKNLILYKITANTTGKVYLKSQSYGDYTGKGFKNANKYTLLIDSQYAASYLPSFTLWSHGVTNKGQLIIKPQSGAPYVLPYNMTVQKYDGYVIQTDDTASFGAAEQYTVDFYISNIVTPMGGDSAYNGYEQEYRKFVYSKYVGVDSETLAYMRKIISENRFMRSDKDIIQKVADYIKLSAAYSFDYDKSLNDCENIAISFLRDYKTGVCKHYAMAATMLYRSLGIPARYTEGVVADVVAGEEVDVSGLNAHAWVEVYVDGFGWQMVEVTGGQSVGGEGVGKDGIDFTDIPDAGLSQKELEDKELYRVIAGKKGPVYLKAVSYGNYVGYGFQAAMAYPNLLNEQYAASYLTPLTLQNSGFTTEPAIIIRNVSENLTAPYVLPYYMSTAIGEGITGYHIQQDDTKSVGNSALYSLKYYKYNSNFSSENNSYFHKEYEQEYYSFVKEQYLQIDRQTKEYMESIIKLKRFNAEDKNIISDVAKYVQSSAKYNFNYDKSLDNSANIAVAFLKNYKEGVCRHYAMAATMLYRALGIPARYTEGVIVNAEKDTEVVVNALMRHAWVEVYIEGLGWQMVEVTGGYGEAPAVPDKEIAPEDIYMYYEDGTVIDASAITSLAGFEKYSAMGYTYEGLSVKGMQIGPGTSQSTIKYVTIYDAEGNDVTDEFIFKPGKLQIYRGILKPVDIEKRYSVGMTPLRPERKLEGFEKYAAMGYSIDNATFFINGSQATPGLSESTVGAGIVIRDVYGNDVTGEFKFENGKIHVYRAELKPWNIEKKYDGTPLQYSDVYPNIDPFSISGFLKYANELGYTITNLFVSGSYTDPGKHKIEIGDIQIVDNNFNDVTNEFKFGEGILHIYREIIYPKPIKKEYDGTPLMYTDNNLYVYAEGNLYAFDYYSNGEYTIQYFYVDGSQTLIGSSESTVTNAAVLLGQKDVTDEFKFGNGTITVVKRKIGVKSNDIEVLFGEKVTGRTVDVIKGSLLAGHSLNVEFLDDNINYNKVGIYDNEFIFNVNSVIDENGNDVTGFYDIDKITQENFGKITIKKKPIVVYTGSAEKNYNGTPLMYDYVWTNGIDIADHTICVKPNSAISTQTYPGVCQNILTVEIFDGAGNNVTSNYKITYVYGKLTVYLSF